LVDEASQAWMRAAGATQLSESLRRNLLRYSRKAATEAIYAGDLARADRMLRRTIGLSPKDADALARLASVLNKAGDGDAARRWLEYARSVDPEHPRVKLVLGAIEG
jgi:Flp pilus assembly protein TadD